MSIYKNKQEEQELYDKINNDKIEDKNKVHYYGTGQASQEINQLILNFKGGTK